MSMTHQVNGPQGLVERIEATLAIVRARNPVDLPRLHGLLQDCKAALDGVCNWKPGGDGGADWWEGECGTRWTFDEGDPEDNDMQYCPKCGKHVALPTPTDTSEAPHHD